MSDADSSDEADEAGGAEFELPLPEEGSEPRIRRRLLGGLRPDDVRAAISSRDEALAVLRRDVSALWLAFGQHERTIGQLIAALEGLGAARVEPPGGRRGDGAEDAGDRGPERGGETGGDRVGADQPGSAPQSGGAHDPGAVGAQLAGLDEVLSAIEQATRSLEQAYADEVSTGEGDRERDPSGPPEPAERVDGPEPSPDRGESGEGEPEPRT